MDKKVKDKLNKLKPYFKNAGLEIAGKAKKRQNIEPKVGYYAYPYINSIEGYELPDNIAAEKSGTVLEIKREGNEIRCTIENLYGDKVTIGHKELAYHDLESDN